MQTAILSRSTPADRLAGVDTWIFDLDNTLYPASCDLFTQVRDRMTRFICDRFGLGFDDARALQRRYFLAHGTTMLGLMKNDGVDPHEFMAFVHDVDLSPIQPQPGLRDALARLPGRRLVYTNASTAHAERVLGHLGIVDLFDGVFDIVAAEFEPKPGEEAFDRMLAAFSVTPARAAFFEDIGRNLGPAAARGVVTVLVRGSDPTITGEEQAGPFDFEVDDLAQWLGGLAGIWPEPAT
jgi:putative hydrolase of the HAD superfamily